MVFRFSLFILLFFLLSQVKAQSALIIDKDTKQPIPFATINSLNFSKASVSNENGEVELSVFNHKDSLQLRALGYKTVILCYCDLKEMAWKIALERKSQIIETVVISASKWAQPSASIARRINKINAEEGQLNQAQTSADVLSASGQVYIQKSQQGGGSPMIRGFSANRLLYAIDGIRINNAIYRSGNLHNVIAIDPFAIESTEVLFGPGSVIYGSDAIGGVMHFKSISEPFAKDSITVFTGSAVSRYSSANNEKTGHLHFSLAKQRLSYTSSFTYNKFGDLKMGNNGPNDYLYDTIASRLNNQDAYATLKDSRIQTPSGYSQFSVYQRLALLLSEKKVLSFSVHHSESTDIPRVDRLIQKQNGKPRNAEWYYGPQKWTLASAEYLDKKQRTYSDEFKAIIAVQNFEESRHNRRFNRNTLNHNYEEVDAYSFNLDLRKKVGSSWHFYYGMELIQNNIKSLGYEENILNGTKEEVLSRYPNSKWQSAAAYFESSLILSEKSTLSAGFRLNYFQTNSRFNQAFFVYPERKINLQFSSPSFSIGYKQDINDRLTLRSSFSRGFRAPNIDDIAKVFDSEPGSVTLPNPELKPETADNIELGGVVQIGSKVLLDFSTYYTLLNKAMIRRDDQFFGKDSIFYQGELSQVQSIQNAAKAYVYGLELAVNYAPHKRWQFKANYNYQQGKEELENGSTSYSRHVAPSFGQFFIQYQKQKNILRLIIEHNGEISYSKLNVNERNKPHLYAKDHLGRPYSPSWTLLHFVYEFTVWKGLSFSGGVKNITDIRYRPYSSGISGPGRNYILSFKYQW